MLVDKTNNVVTTCVYKKFISGLKIIGKRLPQKYNKENVFCYWLFKEVRDLTFEF